MKFHAIQHDVIPANASATEQCIEAIIAESFIAKGDFVVLPEMTTTGFSIDINAISQGDAVAWGCQISKQHGIWLQVGWANRHENRASNCVSICTPSGEILTTYEKVFTCNPFGENQVIDKGNSICIVEIEGRKICPLICYDLRFPELWRLATLAGAEVFTNSANWPIKRIHSWKALLVARAIENQAQVIGCNRIGHDDVAHWGGTSIAISEEGIILACATETEPECLSASFAKSSSESWRNEFKVLQDTDNSLLGKIQVTHVNA